MKERKSSDISEFDISTLTNKQKHTAPAGIHKASARFGDSEDSRLKKHSCGTV